MEVTGAGVVFFDAAAVFRENGEVDVEVLGFLFEDGDFAFESVLVHVGEFVLGIGGEIVCGLLFAEIAVCWIKVVLHLCAIGDLPDSLNT